MESLQGNSLKGYKLEERIGSGGFGAVYRAKQTTIEREVAVKIILPGYANNPDFIRRFESEAQLIARLEHPHITPLIDFWRDPDGAYLVMRYLRGGSVRQSLDHENFELLTISQLLDQLASALDFAHRNRVIHRDIKPGNILLDEDGNAYLADFGIAKDLTISDAHTSPEAVVGSLDYISPEQARSEPVTPKTDIYSLGVTLYEMITGEHPFKEASSVERLYKHINDPLPEIENLPENLRDTINLIIQKATAKNPEERYPDVMALAIAFREGIGQGTSRDLSIVEQLTMREQEILALISDGLSNAEIANELFITVSTVKWHITQLYKKLGVRSRVQAIVRGRELNLIVTGDTDDKLPKQVAGESSISLPEPENPYKGLHAFQSSDVRDFYGRDDLIQKLIDRMCADDPNHRFLAIVGPSGSGKSSLVKAGLIPALWKGDIQGSEKWFVVDMMPGTHPIDKLEAALIRVAANQASNLAEQLQRDERGLLRVADIILPQDDTELVIVVDQFEEVFTLIDDEAQRQHFLDLLRTAVTDKRSRVRVIVTLRADYYDRPLHYPEFGQILRNQMETVLPLSAKGLERAIAAPAERQGVTFEQGLVSQIVSEMNYQAGALPLLQYALTELFDRREGRILTNAAYQEIGGAVGALANRADEIFLSMPETAQNLTQQIFLRLVTLGEGAEDTRRRTPFSELLSISDNTDLIEEIIDNFADYRLLSLDHDEQTRQPTVEVAHEAILREWERLRGWLNDSRDDIRQERILSAAAQDWDQHNRDASYLLRGSRLEQFEAWTQSNQLTLTPLEKYFIETSLLQRAAEEQAERDQIEREKEAEHRQREQEKRSQNLLRLLVAVFAVSTVIAGGLSILAFSLNNQSRQNAVEAQQSALESDQNADQFRSIALTFGAQDALNNNLTDVALALALEANNIENPPTQANEILRQAASSTWIRQRLPVPDARDAIYLHDGERVVTSSFDGRVAIWNIETGEELQSVSFDTAAGLLFLSVYGDGELIAVGNVNGVLRLWNTVTDEVLETTGEGAFHVGAFTADGTKLLASNAGMIHILDTNTFQIQRSFAANTNTVIPSMQFNSDESLLVTGSWDGFARIWDFETGDMLAEFEHTNENPGGSSWVWHTQFLKNDSQLIVAGYFGATLWDWQNEEIVWEMQGRIQDLVLSPDETWLAIANLAFPSAQLYHTATGTLIRDYYGHRNRTQNIDISPDGRHFITASVEGTVVEWPLWWEGTESVRLDPVLERGVLLGVQHPSEIIAADLLTDNTIYMRNLETGEISQVIEGFSEQVFDFTFTPDGENLVIVIGNSDATDSEIHIVDWQTGLSTQFTESERLIAGVTFHPDGHLLAAVVDFRNIIFWDFQTGEIVHQLNQANQVSTITFGQNGDFYSADIAGGIYRWNLQTEEIVQEYNDPNGNPQLLYISRHSEGTFIKSVEFKNWVAE